MDPGSSFGRWRVHVIFTFLSESNFDNDILSEIYHAGTSGQGDAAAAQAVHRKVPKQYKKFAK